MSSKSRKSWGLCTPPTISRSESPGSGDHVALAVPVKPPPPSTHVQDPGAQRSFQSKHLGAQGQAANRGGPVPSPAPGRRGG